MMKVISKNLRKRVEMAILKISQKQIFKISKFWRPQLLGLFFVGKILIF